MNKLFHGLLALAWLAGMCIPASLAQDFDSPFTSQPYTSNGVTPKTDKQQAATAAKPSQLGLLAPNSVNMAPIEGGGRTLGFPGGGSKPYKGVSGGGASGGSLPATSTSSLQNIQTTDDEVGVSNGGPIYGNLGGGN